MEDAAGDEGPESTSGTGGMLASMPAECWQLFVPPGRVIMMRMTSKAVKEKMDGSCAAVALRLNVSFWYKARRSNEAGERAVVLQKVGALAAKYRIGTLGLSHFGLSSGDFAELEKAIGKCTELKCLELEQNDFGADLGGLIRIASITSLTSLNLKQGHNMRINCILSLSDLVTYFPLLSRLCLEGNNIGFAKGPAQATPLRRELQFLSLKENWLGVDGLLRVKEVLGQCPGLTHLDLSHNLFDSAEMDALAGMFAQCTLLSHLSFEGNDMDHATDADLALAKALSPLGSLTDLNLQSCRLGGLLHMGAVLQQSTGLRCLDLEGAMIENTGATTLAGVLATCRDLSYLNVACNRIRATGTEAIAGALADCPVLIRLNMSDNLIWARGAEALGAAIGGIKYLSLSNCGIGARGCEALLGLGRLDVLDVSGNSMHAQGAAAIAGAGGTWHRLKSLSMSSNVLGASGMHAVVGVLERYKTLTSLSLSSNNVQDAGVAILTGGLVQCPKLEELSLSNNNISDAGATSLAGVLPRCTALTELFLSYNEKIGAAGMQALREAEEGSDRMLIVNAQQRVWRRVLVRGV